VLIYVLLLSKHSEKIMIKLKNININELEREYFSFSTDIEKKNIYDLIEEKYKKNIEMEKYILILIRLIKLHKR
jgi:hypothetical protein